jgi:hypothetical protein
VGLVRRVGRDPWGKKTPKDEKGEETEGKDKAQVHKGGLRLFEPGAELLFGNNPLGDEKIHEGAEDPF